MDEGKRRESGQEVDIVEIGKRAISSFGPAVKSALLYTLLGIIIGTLLLWWQQYLEEIHYPYVFWIKFLEHLGVGFMVSAIAVFFYEWGAHIKETVELSRELSDIINNRIEPIATFTGSRALERSLRTLIGRDVEPTPENIQKIISDCASLVDNISALQNSGVWSSEKYVSFISYMIDSVVENSKALRSMAIKGEEENHVIVVQTAAIMADKILTLQMQAMEKGDYYDVISSLPTWKGSQLNKFHMETKEAICQRGVIVRRIFNRLRYEKMEVKDLSLYDAERIMRTHLVNVSEWSKGEGRYEVKVLGWEELDESTSPLLHELIGKAHFGIFKHGNQNVRYGVERADLSNMKIGKNLQHISDDLQIFNDAWEVAKPLSEELIKEIIEELAGEKAKEALLKSADIPSLRRAIKPEDEIQ
jgi:hypothetical protein